MTAEDDATSGVSRRTAIAAAVAATMVAGSQSRSATQPSAARDIPARSLSVPDAVSPELQAIIARPFPPDWERVPENAAAWRAKAAASAAEVGPELPGIVSRLRLTVTPDRIAGVPVFRIAPSEIRPENRARLLMHLHGGGYALFPGEAGAGEGMLMAGYCGFDVISVDYRMAPDYPFPAALDDAAAVWRDLSARTDPHRMAVFGSSAGGGLTLALMLRLKAEGAALPAAIAPGTPWADLTGGGDSVGANEFVDNAIVSNRGWVGAAGPLYAAGRDLRDPLISPLFGDFAGLPPAILTSGTRDLFLSQTVRTHRRLRRAGVDAALQIFEGVSHAQYLEPFVPETEEAFAEIARFFDARLAR